MLMSTPTKHAQDINSLLNAWNPQQHSSSYSLLPVVPAKRKRNLPTPTTTTTPSNISTNQPPLFLHPHDVHLTTPTSRKPRSLPGSAHQAHNDIILHHQLSQRSVVPDLLSHSRSPTPMTTTTNPNSSLSAVAAAQAAADRDAIRCICAFTHDDGLSIACDDCGRWVHAICFDITDPSQVPDTWKCWVCFPRNVDVERAVRIQSAFGRVGVGVRATGDSSAFPAPPTANLPAPGTATAAGGKKRRERRISVVTASGPAHSQPNTAGPSSAVPHSTPERSAGPATTTTTTTFLPNPGGAAGGGVEEEHVEIDDDWTSSYLPITHDIIPHRSTRDKLRMHASRWRGISALSPSSPPPTAWPDHPAYGNGPFSTSSTPVLDLDADPNVQLPSPLTGNTQSQSTHLSPLHPNSQQQQRTRVLQVPTDPADTSASVRPPRYALHTTLPIRERALIAPYRSVVVPSSVYLSDPLNAYAHRGMPQPHVHLVPPPLSLALDARTSGNEARFVRSGCRPNAVLRPVLCSSSTSGSSSKSRSRSEPSDGKKGESGVNGTKDVTGSPLERKKKTRFQTFQGQGQAAEPSRSPGLSSSSSSDVESPGPSNPSHPNDPPSSPAIQFGIFALRDLKAKEEVVLGWEWDDGAVVHELPALLMMGAGLNGGGGLNAYNGGGGFGEGGGGAKTRVSDPHYLTRTRLQMQDIVHSLGSTFTRCACGKTAKGCAVKLMEDVVEGRWMGSVPVLRVPGGGGVNGREKANAHPSSLANLREMNNNVASVGGRALKVDLGPLVGVERGVRTRIAGGVLAGGMNGVEEVPLPGAGNVEVEVEEVTGGAKAGDGDADAMDWTAESATGATQERPQRDQDTDRTLDHQDTEERPQEQPREPTPPASPSSRFYRNRSTPKKSVVVVEPVTGVGKDVVVPGREVDVDVDVMDVDGVKEVVDGITTAATLLSTPAPAPIPTLTPSSSSHPNSHPPNMTPPPTILPAPPVLPTPVPSSTSTSPETTTPRATMNPPPEAQMPPKMRKRWIKHSVEVLRDAFPLLGSGVGASGAGSAGGVVPPTTSVPSTPVGVKSGLGLINADGTSVAIGGAGGDRVDVSGDAKRLDDRVERAPHSPTTAPDATPIPDANLDPDVNANPDTRTDVDPGPISVPVVEEEEPVSDQGRDSVAEVHEETRQDMFARSPVLEHVLEPEGEPEFEPQTQLELVELQPGSVQIEEGHREAVSEETEQEPEQEPEQGPGTGLGPGPESEEEGLAERATDLSPTVDYQMHSPRMVPSLGELSIRDRDREGEGEVVGGVEEQEKDQEMKKEVLDAGEADAITTEVHVAAPETRGVDGDGDVEMREVREGAVKEHEGREEEVVHEPPPLEPLTAVPDATPEVEEPPDQASPLIRPSVDIVQVESSPPPPEEVIQPTAEPVVVDHKEHDGMDVDVPSAESPTRETLHDEAPTTPHLAPEPEPISEVPAPIALPVEIHQPKGLTVQPPSTNLSPEHEHHVDLLSPLSGFRPLSPAISVTSSHDVASVSGDAGSGLLGTATTDRLAPEPPKIRRSMADYIQRRKKQREEEKAAAKATGGDGASHASLSSPIAGSREEDQRLSGLVEDKAVAPSALSAPTLAIDTGSKHLDDDASVPHGHGESKSEVSGRRESILDLVMDRSGPLTATFTHSSLPPPPPPAQVPPPTQSQLMLSDVPPSSPESGPSGDKMPEEPPAPTVPPAVPVTPTISEVTIPVVSDRHGQVLNTSQASSAISPPPESMGRTASPAPPADPKEAKVPVSALPVNPESTAIPELKVENLADDRPRSVTPGSMKQPPTPTKPDIHERPVTPMQSPKLLDMPSGLLHPHGAKLPVTPPTPSRLPEEGEIPSTQTSPQLIPQSRPPTSTPTNTYPRSHTPPTQPRSFHAESRMDQSPPPPHRRPGSALSHHPLPPHRSTYSPPLRGVPSGPRALRESGAGAGGGSGVGGGGSGGGGGGSAHPPHPGRGSQYSSSSYVPRGPLADRDRDRGTSEAHRDWDRRGWSSRGRSRNGGSGGWR